MESDQWSVAWGPLFEQPRQLLVGSHTHTTERVGTMLTIRSDNQSEFGAFNIDSGW